MSYQYRNEVRKLLSGWSNIHVDSHEGRHMIFRSDEKLDYFEVPSSAILFRARTWREVWIFLTAYQLGYGRGLDIPGQKH